MKSIRRIILQGLFLLTVVQSKSQPYQSLFGDSSTSWTVAKEIPDAILTDSFFTGADVNLGGVMYKELLPPALLFIREDTLSGKAWVYDSIRKKEYLIMDLELSVGDSFFLKTKYLDTMPLVDSVFTLNGLKHIRLNYELQIGNHKEKMVLIEGIGSNAGVVIHYGHPWGMEMNNLYLLCKYRDGVQEYWNTAFDSACYVQRLSIPEKNTGESWKVYPNPFSDHTVIEPAKGDQGSYTLYIYSLNGELLRTENFNGRIRIGRGQLRPGLYVFRISDNEMPVHAGKLVLW